MSMGDNYLDEVEQQQKWLDEINATLGGFCFTQEDRLNRIGKLLRLRDAVDEATRDQRRWAAGTDGYEDEQPDEELGVLGPCPRCGGSYGVLKALRLAQHARAANEAGWKRAEAKIAEALQVASDHGRDHGGRVRDMVLALVSGEISLRGRSG
jgi:hypothetical protein